MDKAPAFVHAAIVEQPFHRAPTVGCAHFVDLRQLLGNVHVERASGVHGLCFAEVIETDGAEGMRCDTQVSVGGQIGHAFFGARKQLLVSVEIVAKPLLTALKRALIDTTVAIEDGQEREADAGLFRSAGNAGGQFADIAIGSAARLVVDIMKFGDGRKAGFLHLHEGECGDGFQVAR